MDKNKITTARGILTFIALVFAVCFLPFKKRQNVDFEISQIAKCDCRIVPDTQQLSQLGTEH